MKICSRRRKKKRQWVAYRARVHGFVKLEVFIVKFSSCYPQLSRYIIKCLLKCWFYTLPISPGFDEKRKFLQPLIKDATSKLEKNSGWNPVVGICFLFPVMLRLGQEQITKIPRHVLPHPLQDSCTSPPLTRQMYFLTPYQPDVQYCTSSVPYQTDLLPHPVPDSCTSPSLTRQMYFSLLTRQMYFLTPYQTDLLPHPLPDRFTSSPRTRQMYFLTPYQTDVLLHPLPAHLKVWLQIQY